VSRTCAECAAFDREHLIHHAQMLGDIRHPAVARCRRTPPPWQTVNDNDWCCAWQARPRPAALHEDNGA
jgi:hypothetical protein